MKFKSKQEQYEWWTNAIRKIQSHDKSIRAGCREAGIQFWQYYEWKERVQPFIAQGKVSLCPDEASRAPRCPKSRLSTRSLSFVEITNSFEPQAVPLTLHYKNCLGLEYQFFFLMFTSSN